jgi:hypothetical protein
MQANPMKVSASVKNSVWKIEFKTNATTSGIIKNIKIKIKSSVSLWEATLKHRHL